MTRRDLADENGEQCESPCVCLVDAIARYSAQIVALAAGSGSAA